MIRFLRNKTETNRKTVRSISLIFGGIGLASFYFIKNPGLLLVTELGIGLAWVSILTVTLFMPFY